MNLNQAVKFLRSGKAVVFPTDTAYGLAVDATNAKAIKRMFQIKKRKPTKPVHIVVSSLQMAKRYARFTPQAEKLFKKFLPGPLTLILPLRPPPSVPPHKGEGRKSRPGGGVKLLSAGTGTIGIRMPKNKIALDLVKKLGRPITATSANVADSPTAYSVSQIDGQYRNARLKPDFIIDSGLLAKIQPSTMVKLTDNKIEIIRRGPITKTQILNALRVQK